MAGSVCIGTPVEGSDRLATRKGMIRLDSIAIHFATSHCAPALVLLEAFNSFIDIFAASKWSLRKKHSNHSATGISQFTAVKSELFQHLQQTYLTLYSESNSETASFAFIMSRPTAEMPFFHSLKKALYLHPPEIWRAILLKTWLPSKRTLFKRRNAGFSAAAGLAERWKQVREQFLYSFDLFTPRLQCLSAQNFILPRWQGALQPEDTDSSPFWRDLESSAVWDVSHLPQPSE